MLLPYAVNKYLKDILDAENTNASRALYQYWPSSGVSFIPLNDPEPCDPTGKPLGLVYVRYFWMPGQKSKGQYFMRRDRVRYYVMGRDYNQMWKVAERITEILNPVIQDPTKFGTTDPAPKITVDHYWIVGSNSMAPTEVGGLAATMLEFEFTYRLTDSVGNTNINGSMDPNKGY